MYDCDMHDFVLKSNRHDNRYYCRGSTTTTTQISDDSIYRKYRYIVFDIDISYRIVSSKKYRIIRYIATSFIYHDIFDISRGYYFY